MFGLLSRPTPAIVKRIAVRLGVDHVLLELKDRLRGARSGAGLQVGLILGHVPSRRLRHAVYRAMGLTLGDGAVIYRGLELRDPGRVRIGEGSVIGFDAVLDGRFGITIGRHVNLSSQVAIWTMQHDHRDPAFRARGAPVSIGDRAWLSFRVTLLPGVSVGEGAVVAAGAIVTRDVEAYTIVAGVPARVVGQRSPRELNFTLVDDAAPWFV